MGGILLFDKPIGWTSHDAVAFVRARFGVRPVGHAGTLDPMATGLLLILVGAATQRSGALAGLEKDYRGIFDIGVSTDTQDLEGRVLRTAPWRGVSRAGVEAAMGRVAARGEQTPPQFSALKRGGRPLYRAARLGLAVAVEPRPAAVVEWRLERFEPPSAEFFLRVSKGFYVRTFCHDVGEALGCGAVLTCLVRTRIGNYRLEDAVSAEALRAAGRPDGVHENLQRLLRPGP